MRPDFQGVSYPDRHKILATEGATLTIFVPKPGHEGSIKPRCAIVGPAGPIDSGTVLCHLEAWIHGAMQYSHLDARGQWEAGVLHAAGRAFVEYPTVARAACMRFDLIPVGTITAADDVITITNEEAVTEWLSR